MKIYTKTGDEGTTSLYSGKRISKTDVRLHAYGTTDELNAHMGWIRDTCPPEIHSQRAFLHQIQSDLFALGSHLANDRADFVEKLPALPVERIPILEQSMDSMDAELEPMRHFVLPGGHAWVSQVHIARTVCRRAERFCVEAAEQLKEDPSALQIPREVLHYLNRLSDWLFVLSRWSSNKLGAQETPWIP
jgi:cob(I)alamin adenosyltransferase